MNACVCCVLINTKLYVSISTGNSGNSIDIAEIFIRQSAGGPGAEGIIVRYNWILLTVVQFARTHTHTHNRPWPGRHLSEVVTGVFIHNSGIAHDKIQIGRS